MIQRCCAIGLLAFAAAGAWGAAGRITGTIVDGDGNPIGGATVVVRAREVEMERSDTSDKRGRYTVQVVDASRTFDIYIEREGFVPQKEPIDPVPGGVLRKNFVLQAAGGAAPPKEEMARLEARSKAARHYNEAAKAYDANELDKAAEGFSAAVAEDPELALGWGALGQVELERENWEGALAAAARLAELAPGEPLAMRLQYDALWALGRRDEAEAILDELAEAGGASVAPRIYNVGVEAVKRQDWAKARQMFQRAIEVDPELHIAKLTLAQILVNQGDFEAALASAEQYLEAEPGDARGLQVVFNAHRGLGNTDEAQVVLARLEEAGPELLAEAFLKEGNAHFNAGNLPAAIASLEKVIDLAPDLARAYYLLGLSYASALELDRARANLQRFLELAPDDPDAPLARQMIEEL